MSESGRSNREQRASCARCIYFVRAGAKGPVKIGYAVSVAERVALLQTGNHLPLLLLGVYPGTVALESMLHAKFARERIRGEWFKPSARLLRYIANLNTDFDAHGHDKIWREEMIKRMAREHRDEGYRKRAARSFGIKLPGRPALPGEGQGRVSAV